MKLYHILIVGAGGFAGSIARFIMAKTIDNKVTSLFPYGTLTVNVLGSCILGIVFAVIIRRPVESEVWRLLLGVGFCGGFTTFSTFALENFQLLQQKNFTEFILYASISLVACLLATTLGVWIGNKVW